MMGTLTGSLKVQLLAIAILMLQYSVQAQTGTPKTITNPQIEQGLQERMYRLKERYPERFAKMDEQELQMFRERELQKMQRENLFTESGNMIPPKGISDNSRVSTNDSLALVALYNATGGPNWTNNTNWLTGPVSTWYGITASSGFVYRIELNYNNLSGNIPPEIGNLSNLQYLYFSNNQLTGSIPGTIGNLYSLSILALDNNQLTGSIPAEIGNLTNLQTLSLSWNQITGSIPATIGNLTNLQALSLSGNQFTGSIPATIGNLTNLQSLYLYFDNLTGSIPDEFGNLTNLQNLDLGDNQLTGSIPSTIGYMTNLQSLTLSWNQLSGSIPAQTGNLTNLHILTLRHNYLSGSIPNEIGNLSNLEGLYLSNNQLTGSIPGTIGNLSSLYSLALDNNQLTGSIPAEIGNLTNLRTLIISHNDLMGSIPTEIGNLTNLQYLYLNNNLHTGSIPPEIGNLSSLYYLYLNNNQLTGVIPAEFENLTNLINLYLNNNQLTGSIPAVMCNFNYLDNFYFYDNYFDLGSCPAISCLANHRVDMADNGSQLNGYNLLTDCEIPIPVEIGVEQATICYPTLYYFGDATATNYTSIEWTSPWGGYFDDPYSLNPTFDPGYLDFSGGISYYYFEIVVRVTGDYGWAEDMMYLYFQNCSVQTVIGLDDVWTCADGSGYYFGSVSQQNFWSFQWYTNNGTGFFDDQYYVNPTYYPSEQDYLQGSVEITVDAFGNNGPTSDLVTIHFMPQPCSLPVEIFQNEQWVCADNNGYYIWDVNYNGPWMVEWFIIDGTGSFDFEWNFYPTYYPSIQDYIEGSVILGVTAEGEYGIAQDYLVLHFQNPPEVSAGADATVAAGETFTLSTANANNYYYLNWSTTGDGSFNDTYITNPIYNPGPGDIISGQVTLCLTGSTSWPCQEVQDCMSLVIENNGGNFVPAQLINIGAPGWYCISSFVDLTGKSVSEVMEPVIDKLFAIIDEDGKAYVPSMGINNIASWENKGYKALFADTCTIPFYGDTLIDPTFLVEGTFTYLPIPVAHHGIFINDLLGGFSNQVNLIADFEANQIWWPAAGLITLHMLYPGKAYLLETTNPNSSFLLQFDSGGKELTSLENPETIKNSEELEDQSNSNKSLLNLPEVNIIPSDTTICAGDYLNLEGMVEASNYTAVFWFTTNGGGFLSSNSILMPSYYPGNIDWIQGNVELYVYASNGTGEFVFDHMTLYINEQPLVYAGDDATINAGESYYLSNSYAGNYGSLIWQTMGDGTFSDSGVVHPVYTPGITDINNGSVELCLTADHPPCTPAFSCMNLTIQQQQQNPDSLALVALYNATNGPNWTNKTNWLTGPLNTWYGITLTDGFVTYIHLPNNNLTGILPAEIGNLSHLEYLYLYNNHLSGSIPPEIGNLANLELLHLYSNQLTGTIPPQIGNLSKLMNLDIYHNQLSGSLPDEMGNLSSLRDFNVSDNLFSGSIPLSLCNLNDLLDFYYYYNYFDLGSCPAIACMLNHRVYLGAGIQHNGYDLSTDCNITIPVEIGVESEMICSDGLPYYLGNTTASGYNSIFWYVEFGSGYFDDPNSLNPSYFPSQEDYMNGSCMLVVRVTGDYGWAEDAMWLYFQNCDNLLDIGADFDYVCFPDSYFFGNTTIPNYINLNWVTYGAGYFDCPWCENPTYYPGAEDLAQGVAPIELCIMDEMWMMQCDNIMLYFQAPPEVSAGDDVMICGNMAYQLNALAQNQESVSWSSSGNGTFSSSTILNPIYTPGTSDIASGAVTLTLTVFPIFPCNFPVTDTMIIQFSQQPTVNILPEEQTICYGEYFDFSELVEAGNYEQIQWFTNGAGIFSEDYILEPIYYPNPEIDYSAGCVELGVIVSPSGACIEPSMDFMMLCFQAPPTVNAGADSTICENNNYLLSGEVANSLNYSWATSGDGTFSDVNIPNPLYSPGMNDVSSGSVSLFIYANPISPCTALIFDTMALQILKRPVVYAGVDTALCDSWVFDLDQAYAENYVGLTWETSGDGYFSDSTILNPYYVCGFEDYMSGEVNICLTASGTQSCENSISCITLSIIQSPYVYAGEDALVIGEDSYFLGNSWAEQYNTLVWTTNGDGSFDNQNLINATYFPGNLDVINKCVELTLTAYANDPCTTISQDNVILCFRNLVENVTAFQVTTGSQIVIINYDLVYKVPFCTIVPEVSFDGGLSYQVLNNVYGESGINIPPGNHKFIYWNTQGDIPPTSTDNAIFRITAIVPDWQCGQPITDNRDGKIYNTVRIGSQCWMKENMNIGTRIQGTANQTNNQTIEKYCYQNLESNCDVYGGLYEWDEMMQYTTNEGGQGICPSGWYVPKHSDWMSLKSFLGGQSVAGGKMKEEGTTHWNPPNTGGTNSSGFTGLPGGFCDNGPFLALGIQSFFWLSTPHTDPSAAWYFQLFNNTEDVSIDMFFKSSGFSVRCIHDEIFTIIRPIISVDTNVSTSLNSAYIWANALYDGGAPVTARGICWNTTGNPNVDDNKTVEGTGTGYFYSYLSNLTPNTTYYAKAYATNIAGTSYSEEISFVTNPVSLPWVGTYSITKKTPGAAQTGGEVYYDGGGQVYSRGVCWSTNSNPTVSDNSVASGSGTGTFVITITGLESNTTYFVRAFATNSAGTAYGSQFQFKTLIGGSPCPGASTVTDIDGNIYNTVLIGNQCWMADNLKTTKYRNGSNISHPGPNNTQWQNNTTGAYAYYNQDLLYREKYGLLYNQYAVNNSNGLCPVGWHVPSHAEWGQLVSYVNDPYSSGKMLKSCRQVNSPLEGDCNTQWPPRWDEHESFYGTDDFGFSGLPGGYRSSYGGYGSLGEYGSWWSAYDVNTERDWIRNLYYDSNYMSVGYSLYFTTGRSVRCIKD